MDKIRENNPKHTKQMCVLCHGSVAETSRKRRGTSREKFCQICFQKRRAIWGKRRGKQGFIHVAGFSRESLNVAETSRSVAECRGSVAETSRSVAETSRRKKKLVFDGFGHI